MTHSEDQEMDVLGKCERAPDSPCEGRSYHWEMGTGWWVMSAHTQCSGENGLDPACPPRAGQDVDLRGKSVGGGPGGRLP